VLVMTVMPSAMLGMGRVVAACAFSDCARALWQMAIWYRRAWNTTVKATIDGAICALLTAGVGWLWPR